MLSFVSVPIARHKHQYSPGTHPLGSMGQDPTYPRCNFIIHLSLLPLDVDLIATLLKVPPHAIVPFREGGHDDALLDRTGVVNEGQGGGEVDLSN